MREIRRERLSVRERKKEKERSESEGLEESHR